MQHHSELSMALSAGLLRRITGDQYTNSGAWPSWDPRATCNRLRRRNASACAVYSSCVPLVLGSNFPLLRATTLVDRKESYPGALRHVTLGCVYAMHGSEHASRKTHRASIRIAWYYASSAHSKHSSRKPAERHNGGTHNNETDNDEGNCSAMSCSKLVEDVGVLSYKCIKL
ncbi:hypothetical protein BIW11_09877 [Tropilaelaps mercedesae]|uniref:Uncharacterized protein n=1 Tax=Tropilaelaps mercedesae TaxID=418985 RepID=A0A1V9XIF7_9ACAR|nr:hypothetical protein BIW11_09877 [Tropilaelaps mercedesae]